MGLSSTVIPSDILSFESQAILYAQRSVDKTERDVGVICWELSQLSDQTTTRMWHDLYKRITAHTVNWPCMSMCAGVYRCCLNDSSYRSATNRHHCSLPNTQRAECLSDCHCKTVSVANKQLWISPCKANMGVPPSVSAWRHFGKQVALYERSTQAKIYYRVLT